METFNPKIAILGARGIGRVHARIIKDLGGTICAVAGSSQRSARDAASRLKTDFSITVQGYSDLALLASETDPDAVCICTPPEMHLEHIQWAFDKGLPVMCEKPLYWAASMSEQDIKGLVSLIRYHPKARLMLNTNNTYFIDTIREHFLPVNTPPGAFYFSFHSQGPNRGRDIAVDMLPHGISLLMKVCGNLSVSNYSETVGEHRFQCRFVSGQTTVEFDFGEHPQLSKKFEISIDGRCFQRIQSGRDQTYRVFLQDSETGQRVETQDPFRISIGNFLSWCKNGAPRQQDQREEALENQLFMTKLLRGNHH